MTRIGARVRENYSIGGDEVEQSRQDQMSRSVFDRPCMVKAAYLAKEDPAFAWLLQDSPCAPGTSYSIGAVHTEADTETITQTV
jgi:hypothetical protein